MKLVNWLKLCILPEYFLFCCADYLHVRVKQWGYKSRYLWMRVYIFILFIVWMDLQSNHSWYDRITLINVNHPHRLKKVRLTHVRVFRTAHTGHVLFQSHISILIHFINIITILTMWSEYESSLEMNSIPYSKDVCPSASLVLSSDWMLLLIHYRRDFAGRRSLPMDWIVSGVINAQKDDWHSIDSWTSLKFRERVVSPYSWRTNSISVLIR